jgi:hypothetical protein
VEGERLIEARCESSAARIDRSPLHAATGGRRRLGAGAARVVAAVTEGRAPPGTGPRVPVHRVPGPRPFRHLPVRPSPRPSVGGPTAGRVLAPTTDVSPTADDPADVAFNAEEGEVNGGDCRGANAVLTSFNLNVGAEDGASQPSGNSRPTAFQLRRSRTGTDDGALPEPPPTLLTSRSTRRKGR